MDKRTLGKTHLDVSTLGFGCAPSAFLKTDLDNLAKLVNTLLDRGVNLVDTATMYPGSEEFIGNHLAGRRRDYVLVSKVGSAKAAGITGEPWSDELITSSIDRALRLMKTDHVDVMLLHSCDLATLEADDALASLVKARDAGKIRFAGYSGDNDAAAFAAKLPDIAVIETSINYVDQNNIDAVLPLARKHDVGIIAKRPLANAAWKGAAGRTGIYVNYTREYVKRHEQLGVKASDLGYAESDWAELALRFTLSFPEVTTAIVGTTNAQNALRNLEIASKGSLGAQHIQALRNQFKAAPGSSGWAGQT
jgi:aryl-alcohol dehydrogenase-like predicted oxidoreductase